MKFLNKMFSEMKMEMRVHFRGGEQRRNKDFVPKIELARESAGRRLTCEVSNVDC